MGCTNSKELLDACREGDLESVRKIVDHPDYRINDPTRGFRWDNPLYTAAQAGQTNIVTYLLSKHHDMNGAPVEGEWLTPLYEAMRQRHTAVVRVLMQKGRVLIEAIKDEDVEEVQDLLEQGYDKNMLDEMGNSVLYHSVDIENEEIVQQLCHVDVDINYANRDGMTALHLACARGNMDIVQVLLEYGANIDRMTKKACTPICHAAANGHAKLVRELIIVGANRNVITQKGQDLLLLAATNGRYEVCEFLLYKENMDPEATDKNGNTAIANARYNGHAKVVRLLQDVRDERKGVGQIQAEKSMMRRRSTCRRQSLSPELFKNKPPSPSSKNSPGNLQKRRQSIRKSIVDIEHEEEDEEASGSLRGASFRHQHSFRNAQSFRGARGSPRSFRDARNMSLSGGTSPRRKMSSPYGSPRQERSRSRMSVDRTMDRTGSQHSDQPPPVTPRRGSSGRRGSRHSNESTRTPEQHAPDLPDNHRDPYDSVDVDSDGDSEGDEDGGGYVGGRRESVGVRPGDIDNPDYSAAVDYIDRGSLVLPESENILGVGSSGAPVVAGLGRGGRHVAIKRYRATEFEGRDFEKEFAALWKLQHPRFVSLLYVCTEVVGELWVVTERMEYNLQDYLEHVSGGEPLSEEQQLNLSIDIGEALRHMHKQSLLYGQMKSTNVLLDKAGHAKVIRRVYDAAAENYARSGRRGSEGGRLALARAMSVRKRPALTAEDYRIDMMAFGSMMCLICSGGQDDGLETETAPETACTAVADAITHCFLSDHPSEKVVADLMAAKKSLAKRMREAVIEDDDGSSSSGADMESDE